MHCISTVQYNIYVTLQDSQCWLYIMTMSFGMFIMFLPILEVQLPPKQFHEFNRNDVFLCIYIPWFFCFFSPGSPSIIPEAKLTQDKKGWFYHQAEMHDASKPTGLNTTYLFAMNGHRHVLRLAVVWTACLQMSRVHSKVRSTHIKPG